MEKKNIKMFLILASIGIFLFACVTSIITINYYNRRMQCLYNGIVYNNGDKFMSSDNCNSCTCNNGLTACTLKACLNQGNSNIPLKGLEIYCYTNNNQKVYSILPGTNRLKSYNEVTGESKMLSSPEASFINKTQAEAITILMNEYGYSESTAKSSLITCTPAERLR